MSWSAAWLAQIQAHPCSIFACACGSANPTQPGQPNPVGLTASPLYFSIASGSLSGLGRGRRNPTGKITQTKDEQKKPSKKKT
jgi:hypothetical protein